LIILKPVTLKSDNSSVCNWEFKLILLFSVGDLSVSAVIMFSTILKLDYGLYKVGRMSS